MQTKVYQYNLQGYYKGETIAYNNLLPANTTNSAPTLQDGYIPKWNGAEWEQVENHVGTKGYVNGEEFTVTEYGALPDGWSDTEPEPTLEEARETKLNAWYAYDEEYRKTATVEVDGKFFSISQDAKVNLTSVSLKAMVTQGDTTYYQKNGDSEVYSYVDFMPLSLSIGSAIENAETNFYAVETQINNTVSKEELEAITW